MRNRILVASCAVALLAGAAFAASTTIKSDFGPLPLTNSCTGEIITVSGTSHLVITTLGNGDLQVRGSFKGRGISNDGVKYQWKGNASTKITSDGDSVTVIRNRLIGQGPSNNEFMKTTMSSVNGVFSFEFEIECR